MEETLERRIVTVLFADLVGFTSLSERLDAEDVAAIQDRYFAAVRDTIGRYGGRLEKFIGDAAMAVFGVPRARDDDAERAVRAGLALISAVQQLGVALGLEDETLRLRVGINSGEAVVATGGPDEGRVTGDTVNTAARLQTAAPPNGVLVGETTTLAVADIAELDEPLSLDLKGKARPVAARLVTGLRSEPSREQAMGALRAPTIGRERELSQLLRALDDVGTGGAQQWLILAPPGVGKSRLLRELAAATTERASIVVWQSRARAGSVSPFEAIAGLLRSALGDSGEDRLRDSLASAGTPAARASVVVEACAALVRPNLESSRLPADDRDALFAIWLDAFDALSGGDTQVWLVEDVHWTGGDVLAFLDLAGSRATRGGRLVVATARPSVLELRPEPADQAHGAGANVLRLGTLERTDARALVSALVGSALPPELVDGIVGRSDGNCLFIEELLRTWVSVGTLVAEADGGWQLAVPAEEVPLPQSVQQIYAAQLDDLPPDARRLARRASVAGRRFPVRALEPLEASEAGLGPLRRRELVTGPTTEPIFGDAFSYRHALLRDAGYASLARADRARLHVRLARWLEEAAGARSLEIAEQIATHYASAVESAPALGPDVDQGLSRDQARDLAADWFERAGETTLSLAAHDAARQLLQRSIEFTSPSATLDLARRLQRLAEATAFAADMNEGVAHLERSIALYRSALAADRSATAIAGLASATASLADVWYQQLRFQEAHDLADRTLEELPEADSAARSDLVVARGRGALGATGPSPAVEADLELAVQLARESGDEKLILGADAALASLLAETNRSTSADWLDIADRAARVGDVRLAIVGATNAAGYSLDDAPRNVTVPLARARDLALAHGRTEDLGWIDYLEAEAAFAAGDWDRALRLCVGVMDLGEANAYLRLTVRIIHIAVPIASVRREMGLLERCQRWYMGIEGKLEFPDSPYARIVRPAQDLELADAGLGHAYVPEVAPRIDAYREDPSGPSWVAALDRVLRSWTEANELDGAQRALDALTATIESATGVTQLGLGNYWLTAGRVGLARGDRSGAVESATQALAHFRASDAPWWKAKAIRLLERAEAADDPLIAEVNEIERHLGAVAPTL